MPNKEKINFLQSLRPDKFFARPPVKRAVRHLIMPALLGFLAGLAGAAVIFGYSGSANVNYLTANWTPSDGSAQGTVASANNWSNETARRLGGAVVGVYKNNASKTDIVPPENFLASGMTLTSDGWVVTVKNASLPSTQIGIVVDRRFHPVKQFLADDFDGLLFLKIETRGLSLAPFGHLEDLRDGSGLLGLSADQRVRLINLQNMKTYPAPSQSRSSEELDYFLQTDSLPASTPIFDQKNNFVGLMKDNGLVVPAEVVSRALKSVLKTGKATKTYLGVNYLNLSQNIFVSEPRDGAFLKSGKDGPAILKNSPAAKAGLKEGDIIKAVENLELNKNYSLSEAVANYEPGTKIVVTIERGGQEKKIEITLGESK